MKPAVPAILIAIPFAINPVLRAAEAKVVLERPNEFADGRKALDALRRSQTLPEMIQMPANDPAAR